LPARLTVKARRSGELSRAGEPARLRQPVRAFLAFLQRRGRLDLSAAAAAQVTSANVDAYITELRSRVRSVTVYNCVYKVRRAAELIAPETDFSWLAEIEKDLALVMEPRSKYDRLVDTDRLVEAGLTLIAEPRPSPPPAPKSRVPRPCATG
jgi:hypothetical protein